MMMALLSLWYQVTSSLGKPNHLASQTYGESHLVTTISRSHLELRRHPRRFVAAEIQIVQLPVNANQ
jgi:hypothetical protein